MDRQIASESSDTVSSSSSSSAATNSTSNSSPPSESKPAAASSSSPKPPSVNFSVEFSYDCPLTSFQRQQVMRFAVGLAKYSHFFDTISGIMVLAVIHYLFHGTTSNFKWPEKFIRFALHVDIHGHGVTCLLHGPGNAGMTDHRFDPILINLPWPSLRTIQLYIPKLKVSNRISLEQLQQFALRLIAEVAKGLATIFIRIGCDEVHCVRGLWFVGDEVIGAVDGHHPAEDALTMDASRLANQCMIFRVGDLSGNVSSNCGLFATNTMSAAEIIGCVTQIIVELKRYGIIAKVFTGDCSQANLTTMKHFDDHFAEYQLYTFACYVHAFKLIRNPLLSSGSLERTDVGVISLDFVRSNRDLFPLVSDEHLNTSDKMKVDPALALLNAHNAEICFATDADDEQQHRPKIEEAAAIGEFMSMASAFWNMFDIRCTSTDQLDPQKPNRPVMSLEARKASASKVYAYFAGRLQWVKSLSDAAVKSIVRNCQNLIRLIDFMTSENLAHLLKPRGLSNDDIENTFSLMRAIMSTFAIAQAQQMYPRVSLISAQREAGYEVAGYHPTMSRGTNTASSRRETDSIVSTLPPLQRAVSQPVSANAKAELIVKQRKRRELKELTKQDNPAVLQKHNTVSMRTAVSRNKPFIKPSSSSQLATVDTADDAADLKDNVEVESAAASSADGGNGTSIQQPQASDMEVEIKRFKCPECDAVYAQVGSHMARHLQTKHYAHLKQVGAFDQMWPELAAKIEVVFQKKK